MEVLTKLRPANSSGTWEMRFKMISTQKEIIDFAKSKVNGWN